MVTRTEKPWGHEDLVEINEQYVVKLLFMGKGEECSLQYHNKKVETIMALRGTLTVCCEGESVKLRPYKVITIKPRQVHKMVAEESYCLYLECSTPELADTVRISDKYGRVTND